jgi:HD-like signal output (HDOD) protein
MSFSGRCAEVLLAIQELIEEEDISISDIHRALPRTPRALKKA